MTDTTKPITVGAPAPLNRFVKDEHLGHFVLFFEAKQENMQTSFGDADAAICTYIVCHTCMAGWEDQAVFGSAIAGRLYLANKDVVPGRLVQGVARPGRNAPWLLDDPNDAEDRMARELVARVATRLGSGKLVVDLAALEKKF